MKIELPQNIVEAIRDFIEFNDKYDSIEDFVVDAIHKEINRILEIKKRDVIHAISNTVSELNQIKYDQAMDNEKLKQKLDVLFSELSRVVDEYSKITKIFHSLSDDDEIIDANNCDAEVLER